MGFIAPSPPPVDYEEWSRLPHLDRIKPLAQDWAINGVGSPTAVYLLYVVKLIVFVVAAFAVIGASTPGLGGLGEIGDWWTEPIVFQKLAVWTMLWELIGLGCGSMPLTFRFIPPIGGILYWLRPGTVRLPPWPDRVPFTAGSRRTILDTGLYAFTIATLVGLLLSDGEAVAGTTAGRLEPLGIALPLIFLALLGLRDKVAFLGARPEVYGPLLIIGLFPLSNLIVGSQLVFLCIWLGAASSKLNRHFPFVVSVMISNTPWNRSRKAKAKLYREYPENLMPSRYAALAAHTGTVMEFGLPLLLFFTSGGFIGTVAVVGMIIFHTHITSTFPLAVPLEWNLFMIFGLLFLFGHYGDVPLSTLDDPLLIAILLILGLGVPIYGNLRPDRISFLPSMRYYAGNWATSQWLFEKASGAEAKMDRDVYKVAPIVVEQLTRVYDRETAELLLNKGLAFRSMHTHGRGLNALLPHAVEDVEAYDVREGELVSGVINGWNFGDGHFHNEQLLAAIQEQCDFEPGQVRVIVLESQPAHIQRQWYRIYDAATGLIEEGSISVRDMAEALPWLGGSWDFPVHVEHRHSEPEPPAAPEPSPAT